ncbi:TetR family transcriptional regulator [Clostridium sp. BL-8]|uniref:TetR family transcriptional regulator n=1 Tax=Clostridium sp. BL-8 TaxID=349938 RepID=UPI00098C0BD3|nr:TetR family transcriptional regulator [Clostridium sp. BL-8]OOM73443.1 HTH-type transcriptional repressor [Clostridium sp. BL-8]
MRNSQATQERILEAAMAEFSTYGISGARVDRIAKIAECNKNLIYMYFGNKESLFTTIFQKHLSCVYKDIVFTPDDLPGYAVRVFEFAMTHPDLMRLMAWFSLEGNTNNPVEREHVHNEKIADLDELKSKGAVGKEFSSDFILTAIMALATAWTATNPFGSMMNSYALDNFDTLKNEIFKAVNLITKGKEDTK